MARDASALDISTKPKPRGRPVSRSVIRDTFSTVPCLENKARTPSSVAVKGRLPTYSFVTAEYSKKGPGKQAVISCLLRFAELARVADVGREGAPGRRMEAKGRQAER